MSPRCTPLDAWTAARLGCGAPVDPGEVTRLQLSRVRETVEWAAGHSAFYRRRLAGVDPRAIDSLEALATLPFTTGDELRAEGERMLCLSQSEVQRVVTLPSSGTTGPAKRLRFTGDEQEDTVDFFQHGMSTLVGEGDRVLILLPGRLDGSVGALLATGLERLGAIPVPHGPVLDLPAAAEAIGREAPTSVVGAPVQVLALQRYAEEVVGVRWRPRTALLTTDYVPGSLVRRLEEGTGCRVFEHYGMTEMGLGGAVDCEAHQGYHLREPDLLFEIVDPATGAVRPEGASGEVVVTTLRRRGMPLVRYRTGDRARMLPGGCACGSRLRRLERVRGRIQATGVACGDGIVTLPELDEALFAVPGLNDFTAGAGGDPGRARLRVEARWLRPGPGARAAVEKALDGIPSLHAAARGGALAVEVEVGALGDRPWTGMDKRVIHILDA